MRARGWGIAAVLLLVARGASAQNAKESCADASERGQKLVDARKLLEARNAFIYCAQESCPGAVRRDCQAQLADVKKNIPSIVVRVKEKDGSDVARGEVSLDGVKIGVLDGQDVEIDPGTHAVAIALPDGRSFNRTIILAPGERGRAVTFDAGASTASASPAVVEPTHPVPPGGWTTVKKIGLVGIVVGGTALVTGVVTQLLALQLNSNKQSELNQLGDQASLCNYASDADPGDTPGPQCHAAWSFYHQAIGMQTATLGLFIGGGVVMAAGVVMFVVGGNKPAPSAFNVTPAIGPHFAGLSIGGSF